AGDRRRHLSGRRPDRAPDLHGRIRMGPQAGPLGGAGARRAAANGRAALAGPVRITLLQPGRQIPADHQRRLALSAVGGADSKSCAKAQRRKEMSREEGQESQEIQSAMMNTMRSYSLQFIMFIMADSSASLFASLRLCVRFS